MKNFNEIISNNIVNEGIKSDFEKKLEKINNITVDIKNSIKDIVSLVDSYNNAKEIKDKNSFKLKIQAKEKKVKDLFSDLSTLKTDSISELNNLTKSL